MPLDPTPIEKKAISESVADQLRLAILSGEVAVGERLPAERALAPRFGTNRNTLREAIRSLEAQGLVTARQGDGVRVADFRRTGELSLLPDMIRTADPTERLAMLSDVLDMRRHMAVEVAALAAERAPAEARERLAELWQQQQHNDGDLLRMLQTDLEIYAAMTEAACSVVAWLMFHTVSRLSMACLERIPELIFIHPRYAELMGDVVAAVVECRPGEASRSLDLLFELTDGELRRRLGTNP